MSPFLNEPLLDYCRRHGITVSRGRGYRKNDQAYVEQRNWFAVRRLVGRDRYASRAALHLFRRLSRCYACSCCLDTLWRLAERPRATTALG